MLDLYMTTLEQWGLILAIRMGSAAYTKWLLSTHCRQRGYQSRDGQIIRLRDGQIVPMLEEADLFVLLGLPYVEPWVRETS